MTTRTRRTLCSKSAQQTGFREHADEVLGTAPSIASANAHTGVWTETRQAMHVEALANSATRAWGWRFAVTKKCFQCVHTQTFSRFKMTLSSIFCSSAMPSEVSPYTNSEMECSSWSEGEHMKYVREPPPWTDAKSNIRLRWLCTSSAERRTRSLARTHARGDK